MYAGNPGDVKKRHDKSHIEYTMMIDPEQLEVKVIHMIQRKAGEKLLYASGSGSGNCWLRDILIHAFRIQF